MSGEQTQHEHRPQDHRPSSHKGESDGAANNRNRNRRSGGGSGGGGRKGAYRFDDQFEHDICQRVTHLAPQAFPAFGRTELATMPPVEVARTESRILLCDRMHTGAHLWPNGDETGNGEQKSTIIVVESTQSV